MGCRSVTSVQVQSTSPLTFLLLPTTSRRRVRSHFCDYRRRLESGCERRVVLVVANLQLPSTIGAGGSGSSSRLRGRRSMPAATRVDGSGKSPASPLAGDSTYPASCIHALAVLPAMPSFSTYDCQPPCLMPRFASISWRPSVIASCAVFSAVAQVAARTPAPLQAGRYTFCESSRSSFGRRYERRVSTPDLQAV